MDQYIAYGEAVYFNKKKAGDFFLFSVVRNNKNKYTSTAYQTLNEMNEQQGGRRSPQQRRGEEEEEARDVMMVLYIILLFLMRRILLPLFVPIGTVEEE